MKMLVLIIYDLTEQIYYATPGFFATNTRDQLGLNNDQVLGNTLYDLAAANIMQCFGNPTSVNTLSSAQVTVLSSFQYITNYLSTTGLQQLTGFALEATQFTPQANNGFCHVLSLYRYN